MEKSKELWKIGVEEGFRVIRWAEDGNVDYDWGREISNRRFDLSPIAIAFPKTAKQVARCLTFCVESGTAFRVRSGGHQHEGMSSLEDGVMIRLSELNAIEYVGEDHAWIGVGKPLKEIYDELELRGKTIPGGGCWAVNVGGLALGGGWGTSVRKMGLTCENIDKIEMVTAKGEVICVSGDENQEPDLFWALRGGGGGNFGIVTRFLFRLSEIGDVVSNFTMQWEEPEKGTEEEKAEYLATIVHDYLEMQAALPPELTTVMGLRVKHRFMKKYYPLGLSGKFYGPKDELQAELESFVKKHSPQQGPRYNEKRYKHQLGEEGTLAAPGETPGADSEILLSDLINEVVDFVQLSAPFGELEVEKGYGAGAEYIQHAPPSTTCLAPWPHKISSGFPKSRVVYPELARKAVRILLETNKAMPDNAARLYMVLHSMPGKKRKIGPSDSAFFWRDKDFLVQFQAWWAEPSMAAGDADGKRAYERDEERYLCWIRSSRKQLESELEGAFINFVDRDLPLETYYGGNLPRLKRIKARYDRDNVFHFPLSIPPDEFPLKREAVACLAPSGFDVVTRNDPRYEVSRRISNTRFDLRPLAVAYPRAAKQVASCIRYCQDHHLDLRICSGGHHHEGMSSADDVLMVRLSAMSLIEFVEGRDDQAWIGVGARLEDVYRELQKRRKIIAAGGCKSVNVGGLTLGGGWGLSARKLGLACDNVLAAEVVLADGDIVEATRENENSDLFWALLGGGGGNFGIVTRFLFRLHAIEPNLSKYKLYWHAKGPIREKIIRKWLAFQRSAQSTDTTSYLLLYADLEGEIAEKPRLSVYAGGMSYKNLADLEEEVALLVEGLPEAEKSEREELYPPGPHAEGASISPIAPVEDFLSYAEDPPGLFLRQDRLAPSDEDFSECRAKIPKDNCLGSYPHKVTSAFPIENAAGSAEDYEKRLAKAISQFLEEKPVNPYVKSYISLYSMGGAIEAVPPESTAFWYRAKPFVIQIESWWSYPEPEPEPCGCRDRRSWQQAHIDWVRSFRDTLRDEKLIEGAFINFVDKDLEKRNKSTKDRMKLLRHYYGKHLERLMESKAKWDPSDFFRFEMSIPLPEEK